MKIVIDGRMWSWTGIGRYTRELVENLQELDHKNQYVVLMQPEDARKWKSSAKNFKVEIANIPPYSLAEQLRLPQILTSLQPDLVHFVSPNIPMFYRAAHITTVHDLTLIDYKNVRGDSLFYNLKQTAFKSLMKTVVRHSARIITPTNYVRQQIIDRYKADPEKVIFTHEGVASPRSIENNSRTIEGDYLFYVGNFYPYKNLGKLIDAMVDIVRINPDLKLVLAGKKDYFAEQLEQQISVNGLQKNVVFTGYANDQELADLYSHAKLYVFPSLSEGFGLPPLEAMSYGTPVVAADASCLPEVLGDAAKYFDPLSTDDIASTINSLLANDEERKRLAEAGKQHVKKFSWRKMAEQTLEIYKEVLDQK